MTDHSSDTAATLRTAAAPAGVPRQVGFYGKLISHGDFLSRRVPEPFVATWDAWLQESMAVSRATLAERWLDIYLTSPVWRFAFAPGACGDRGVFGLMAPSVDKVGRYFPLTVVSELPPNWTPLDAASSLQSFFEAAEQLVVDTVAADRIDFEEFDAAVSRLESELAPLSRGRDLVLDATVESIFSEANEAPWQIPIGAASQLDAALQQAVAHRLTAVYDPAVLLWTAGSDIVEPSFLISRGLPVPEAFVSLMDGGFRERRWNAVAVHAELPSVNEDTLIDDATPPRFRSAAASHTGLVRQVNQDSYLERPDAGLWVVADGVGGHQDGDVASRMVCDALAALVPDAGFEELIEGAGQRLHDVNDHLVRAGARPVNPVVSGSTVVALMLRGTRCAVLWAGDSRVYRWRDGEMRQLTRDHSVAEAGGSHTAEESHAITRAVGGDATLALDLFRDRVRPGDRFLLCSDGLTRVLWESEIADRLGREDVQTAAEGLLKATLDGGAPDNVTVVVVEAYADEATYPGTAVGGNAVRTFA